MNKIHLLEEVKEKFKQENIYSAKSVFFTDIDCEIAYLKKFKLIWFATQLKVFLSIGVIDEIVTKEKIEGYSGELFNYAKNNYTGIPGGLQSGIASIAILAAENIENSAKEYCYSFSKKRWSGFEVPVLVDLSSKEIIYFNKRPLWGFIYYSFLKKLIETNCNFIIKKWS